MKATMSLGPAAGIPTETKRWSKAARANARKQARAIGACWTREEWASVKREAERVRRIEPIGAIDLETPNG